MTASELRQKDLMGISRRNGNSERVTSVPNQKDRRANMKFIKKLNSVV